jgi:hypothetical protein
MTGPLIADVIDAVAHARGLEPGDLTGRSGKRKQIAKAVVSQFAKSRDP